MPGPGRYPFTVGAAPGALPLLGHGRALARDPLAFLAALSECGDLVEIRIGSRRVYVPCHPDLVRKVLTDHRTYGEGGPLAGRTREAVATGPAGRPPRDHGGRRRPPSLDRGRLAAYGEAAAYEADVLTGNWRDGQVVEAYPVFFDLFLRVVTRALFSAHLGAAAMGEIHRTCEAVLDATVPRLFTPPALLRLPLPANRRYDRALAELRAVVDRIVADYRRDGRDHGDLLSALLRTRDADGRGLGAAEVHHQVLGMLTAGSENPAAALSWALYLIGAHPGVARRLEAETAAVLPGGRAARHEDLAALDLTGRVVTETLRLYPPVWLATRTTTAPADLAGRRLPPGTTLVLAPSAVHRARRAPGTPHGFDPDRRPPEHLAAAGAYAALGAVARTGSGDEYGRAATVLALATVLSRWSARPTAEADLRPEPLTAVHRPRRLPLLLTARPPGTA